MSTGSKIRLFALANFSLGDIVGRIPQSPLHWIVLVLGVFGLTVWGWGVFRNLE